MQVSGPDGVVAKGIRHAQNAMTPVRDKRLKIILTLIRVAEMCAVMEKNAHLDAEYKKDLARMFEEAIENEELEDRVCLGNYRTRRTVSDTEDGWQRDVWVKCVKLKKVFN